LEGSTCSIAEWNVSRGRKLEAAAAGNDDSFLRYLFDDSNCGVTQRRLGRRDGFE
jgi:hypothetical protein